MNLRIGVDLDNTIISYDACLHAEALRRGWIGPDVAATKKAVRDAIRDRHGNDPWVELQAYAYSAGMDRARLMDGCADFFAWARAEKIPVFVVSHKTRRSAFGDVDLHVPAIRWLESQGFLAGNEQEPGGRHQVLGRPLGLRLNEQVFLEETRQGKCTRIASLGVTHFVDDLIEFLTDPDFPKGVERLQYAPDGGEAAAGVRSLKSWGAITEYFKDRHEAQ